MQFAQLLDRVGQLADRGVELRRRAAGSRQLPLHVAEREPDRDEPLLRSVVEVSLEPAAFLVADRDDTSARLLHLGQPPAHLHAQPGDLDRQPRRLDHVLEQVRSLCERFVVDDGRELERSPLHRRDRAPVRRQLLRDSTCGIDVEADVRQPEEQLEGRVGERLSDHLAGRLGCCAPGAQLREEALDRAQAFVAGAIEAAVDNDLKACAQWAEDQRDRERGGGRGERRARSDRHAERRATAAKTAASATVSVT